MNRPSPLSPVAATDEGGHPAAGSAPATHACLLICTFNNARTLVTVIERARSVLRDVLVVNDGSTDETQELLRELDGVDVLTHATNRGKGAAIRSGLDRARARGFTHAITMDADGQHSADDIPKFLNAIRENPGAMVLGDRRLTGPGRSRKSRILRVNSNFWTWVATGQRVSDSQTGFRAYPLAPLAGVRFGTTRYDFEIESLVVAIWNGVPVRSVSVSAEYGPGSESHFRPFVDFMRVARLNVRLIAQRVFLPRSIRQRVYLRDFAEGTWSERLGKNLRAYLLQESTSPARFAACVGVGFCCGILPIWGFQAALGLVLAQRLNLSRTLTVLATNISLPVFMPFILYCSIFIGHRLLSGEFDPGLGVDGFDSRQLGRYAVEYLVGSTVFSFVAGGIGAAVAFALSSIAVKFYRAA